MNQDLGLAFFVDNTGQLKLNLTSPPDWLAGLVVALPDGRSFTHSFGEASPPPAPLPVRQLIAGFVDHLEIKEGAKHHTLTGYRQRLGQFARWLELHPDLLNSDPGTWLAYYACLVRRQPAYSPYSLRNHYDTLTRFARWLCERQALPAHPLADVQRPEPIQGAEPKAIEKKHINKMLTVARNPRDRALLLFFRDTGCRANEAVEVTWGSTNLEEGKAEVVGKGDKARKLFFKALTRRALERYRATLKQAGPDDPIFWGKKGPLGYDGLYKVFKRLAEEAGLGDEVFNPHAWRHAFGRDTTMAGIPTAQLQDLMGHSTMETTKIYARFNTLELQQAHNRYSPVNGDLTRIEDVVK